MNRISDSTLGRLLRASVAAGVESAVRLYIERGRDLECHDESGRTPLMIAASRNRARICRLLLESGANAHAHDRLGMDVLQIARLNDATDAARELEKFFFESGHAAASQVPDAVEDWAEISSGPEDWTPVNRRNRQNSDLNIRKSELARQQAISAHVPLVRAAEWNDVDAVLPDRSQSTASRGLRKSGQQLRSVKALEASSPARTGPEEPATQRGSDFHSAHPGHSAQFGDRTPANQAQLEELILWARALGIGVSLENADSGRRTIFSVSDPDLHRIRNFVSCLKEAGFRFVGGQGFVR